MLSTESASKGGAMVFYMLATLLLWLIDLGALRFQSDGDEDPSTVGTCSVAFSTATVGESPEVRILGRYRLGEWREA
jgi:hypothetical protein